MNAIMVRGFWREIRGNQIDDPMTLSGVVRLIFDTPGLDSIDCKGQAAFLTGECGDLFHFEIVRYSRPNKLISIPRSALLYATDKNRMVFSRDAQICDLGLAIHE